MLVLYNPYAGALKIDISLVKCTVQFSIALPVTKGEKRTSYIWKDAVNFSLSAVECAKLDKNFKLLVAGTYRDEKAKDPKYAHVLTFTHYSENLASHMSFLRSDKQDKLGNNNIILRINPANSNESYSYSFREEELYVFYHNFIRKGAHDLVFQGCLYGKCGAIMRLRNKETYDNTEQTPAKTNSNQPQNYNRSSSPPPQGYKQPSPRVHYPSSPTAPPQTPSPVPPPTPRPAPGYAEGNPSDPFSENNAPTDVNGMFDEDDNNPF